MARISTLLPNLFGAAALIGGSLLAPACASTQAAEKPAPAAAPVAEKPKASTDSPQAMIADAGKLLQQGKVDEARAKYGAVLKKDPQSFDARLGIASCDLRLGKLDSAEQGLVALQKEKPDAREVVILLGLVAKEKGDYEGGIALYKAALEKQEKAGEPPNTDLLNNLIVMYRLAKQYDEGAKTCTKLLSRDPKNADALKNLSLIYFDQGKYALAETIAVNSLKLNDKDAALYNNRGMIRVKRERYPEAVSFFKKAVEIDPTLLSPHLNLGSIALRYRDYETAARHFGEAMKLEPRQPEANLGYGFALSGQQKAQDAIAQLQRALEINPDATDAVGEIAMITKLQLNNLEGAQDWCGKYRAQKGKLDDKDSMKAECDNIDNEIKSKQMAKQQMEKLKAQEAAEAPPAAAPAEKPDAAAPTAAPGG